MKTKNILKYLLLIILMLQVNSCVSTDAEQKFEDSPTERLNKQKKELDDLLLSAKDGWKAVYYTDDNQLGGFTHLFKFLPNGKVDMASDFDDDTEKHNSQYEIQLGSTVSVVFTTENKIHLLSDSGNSPLAAGKGFLGDFQFLFYGQENGDLVFKSNRTVKEVRFVKATPQDWDDLKGNTIMNKNITGDINSPLFRTLETTDGTTVKKYELNYNSVVRFGTAIPLQDGNAETLKLAVAFTPTGITVRPAIIVGSQKLTDFVYNETDKSFVATGTSGAKATIQFTNAPPRLTDDYKLFLEGGGQITIGYIAANLSGAATNSPYAKAILAQVNAALPANQKIARVQIAFNDPLNGNYIAYTFTGGKATIYHFFTTSEDAVNKTIILTDDGWIGTPAARAFLKVLDDEITNPKGLYLKKESFTIFYTNVIYTYASAATPFRLTNYKF
ncbi:DUF4302 domain-containing protein [Flavobacterium pectinovorum]|uniref:DUF4302 domain-containing protein n=1 Tax=Flavobacterium pectinovorum TaxID=29533 RepID=A0A502F7R8_9FLAO|nr:DUF4302 domain-containing protein [Flavobacterium pectinovorum]TPG45416.1 DUF4302 domain-containing protein [Flavobacterium pectinovorum]